MLTNMYKTKSSGKPWYIYSEKEQSDGLIKIVFVEYMTEDDSTQCRFWLPLKAKASKKKTYERIILGRFEEIMKIKRDSYWAVHTTGDLDP